MRSDGERGLPLLDVLDGRVPRRRPIWLMRQAGRYLPEYRAVRAQAGSFLELCYTPRLAAEVTLQPLRRFDLDAAIVFADILLVPHAMGLGVDFQAGEGPVLETVRDAAAVRRLRPQGVVERLTPVMETLGRVSADKDPEVALIGFCGAPWTVASYMIEGGSSDRARARMAAAERSAWFAELIELVTGASISYLVAQLRAGAEVVQVFDSWAGDLGAEDFERWSIRPMRRIVEGVRREVPNARIIGFPRGVGPLYGRYAAETEVNSIGVDSAVPVTVMRDELAPICAVQGNVDPRMLVTGGSGLDEVVDRLLESLDKARHIMNLGHGILPETPLEHVARLVERVRATER